MFASHRNPMFHIRWKVHKSFYLSLFMFYNFFSEKTKYSIAFQPNSSHIWGVLTEIVRADILVKSVLKILSYRGISTISLVKDNKQERSRWCYISASKRSRRYTYSAWAIVYYLTKGSREPHDSCIQWFPRFLCINACLGDG